MNKPGPNPAASVRQRLLNLSKAEGSNLDELLTRFAISRLLYRLDQAGYGDEFVLKGATLFSLWQPAPHRATRDLDLLGRGETSIDRLVEIFRAIAVTEPPEPDGLVLDPASVIGGRIREDQEYEGVRILLQATLTNARIRLQVDVGFGDVVWPAPEAAELPGMLGFAPARLRAYPKEAVIAEKFHAMVVLGEGNTRLKDFYDLWTLAMGHSFTGQRLAEAIASTFARRRTDLPTEVPVAFTPRFTEHPTKLAQWRAFLKRAGVQQAPPPLGELAALLEEFLHPIVAAILRGEASELTWLPGGPWRL